MQEFQFTPAAVRFASKEGILKVVTYIAAYLFSLWIIYALDPDGKIVNRMLIYTGLFILFIVAPVILNSKKSVLDYRLQLNDEQLELTKLKKTVYSLKIREFSWIMQLPDGTILIYYKGIHLFPVMLIRNIEKHEEFVEYLSAKVPIKNSNKLPFLASPWFKIIFGFLFITSLILIFSEITAPFRIVPEILFFVLISYNVFVLLKLIRIYKKYVSLLLNLILIVVVVLKIALT